MKRLLNIIILLTYIFFCIFNLEIFAEEATLPAVSGAASYNDNGCIQRNITPIEWGFAESVLTFGAVDIIRKNFKMIDIKALETGTDGFGESRITNQIRYTSDGKKIVTNTKVRLCDVQTDEIQFCFKPILSGQMDCTKDLYTLKADESTRIGRSNFRAIYVADQLCVQRYFWPVGWINMGCKFGIPRQIASLDGKYVNTSIVDSSCVDNTQLESNGLLPMTAAVTQCVQSSIRKFLFDSGLMRNFRDYLESFVQSALVLFMTFVGFKIVLGAEQYRKHEAYIAIFKFGIVLYLTSFDGLKWVYDSFISIADGLSAMVYEAGPQMKLCDYSNYNYSKDFILLRTWDSIDCRLLYYFGLLKMDASMLQTVVTSLEEGNILSLSWEIIKLFITLIFTLNIVHLIMILAIAILFLSIIVSVLNTYIVAYFAISIVIFVSPIFVPMMLFAQTKNYFDQWLKSLIGYSLQPMILMVFIALMLTSLDQAMYRTCTFSETQITKGTKVVPFFTIDNMSDAKFMDECRSSLGYRMGNVNRTPKEGFLNVLFARIPILGDVNAFIDGMAAAKVLGLIILFYFISPMIGGFATDLTGAANLSEVGIGTQTVANKAMEAGWKGAKFAANFIAPGSGVALSQAEKLAERTKDDVSDSTSRSGPRDGYSGGGDDTDIDLDTDDDLR